MPSFAITVESFKNYFSTEPIDKFTFVLSADFDGKQLISNIKNNPQISNKLMSTLPNLRLDIFPMYLNVFASYIFTFTNQYLLPVDSTIQIIIPS